MASDDAFFFIVFIVIGWSDGEGLRVLGCESAMRNKNALVVVMYNCDG